MYDFNNTTTLYMFEGLEGCCGDYLPFVIAIEQNGSIEPLYQGDNSHNLGYTEYFDGYKDCLESFCDEKVETIKINISTRKDLEQHAKKLRACRAYDEFLEMIEDEEKYG